MQISKNETINLVAMYPHLIGHMIGKDRLTNLHSEMIKHCYLSQCHTTLQAHRGSFKTTAIDVVGAIWWWLFHPSDRIALVRNTFTDAAEILRMVRNIFESNQQVRYLFKLVHGFYPRLTTKRENTLIFNFKQTKTPEGSFDAYGITTNLTGKHYDKMMLDDVVVIDDRNSRAKREKTIDAIREILTNIIDPGKFCSIIGTPWHPQDAYTVCPIPLKFDVYQTGILTNEEIERKRATTTAKLFAINYELKHVNDESLEYSDPQYSTWNYAYKEKTKIYMHIDAKYMGNHTNGITVIQKIPNKFQVHGLCTATHIKENYGKIRELYNKYHVSCVLVETNGDKGFLADELAKQGMIVRSYHEKIEKKTKISAYVKKYFKDIVFCNNPGDDYMTHIVNYEDTYTPDDSIDSLASVLCQVYDTSADYLYSM